MRRSKGWEKNLGKQNWMVVLNHLLPGNWILYPHPCSSFMVGEWCSHTLTLGWTLLLPLVYVYGMSRCLKCACALGLPLLCSGHLLWEKPNCPRLPLSLQAGPRIKRGREDLNTTCNLGSSPTYVLSETETTLVRSNYSSSADLKVWK